MPSWAGSSWYFLRYMDPHNDQVFLDPERQEYWQSVDLYVGGREHATGHLLYARFLMHFLSDRGYVHTSEPFQKLINQGMIQGVSHFVYRIQGTHQFVSYNLRKDYATTPLHVPIHIVQNGILDQSAFQQWYGKATFLLEGNQYLCGQKVEKMSKSKLNVVSPDTIISQYGADSLRLYTMFLGPIDQSKPWDTRGIEGVSRFLHKVWKLFYAPSGTTCIQQDAPTPAMLTSIHQAIQKVERAITTYAFHTAISALMICVNTLIELQCHHQAILQDLAVLLSPFAPHIAEELWEALGNTSSITYAPFPKFLAQHLQTESVVYPLSVNGKVRAQLSFPSHASRKDIELQALHHPSVQKWTQGKKPKKVIIVAQKIVNIVV